MWPADTADYVEMIVQMIVSNSSDIMLHGLRPKPVSAFITGSNAPVHWPQFITESAHMDIGNTTICYDR